MKKTILKKLIKEVLKKVSEEENNSSSNKETSDAGLPSTSRAREKSNEMIITLVSKGIKPNSTVKKALAKMVQDAKISDLEIIKADVYKNGKSIVTMDVSDLRNVARSTLGDSEKEFDITKATSFDNKSNKSRPPIPSSPKSGFEKNNETEWKQAEKRDLDDANKRLRLKNSQIKSGTYNKDDTSLWSDDDWKNWEKEHPDMDDETKQILSKVLSKTAGQKKD